MKLICEIYRSPNEEGMYLYVKKEDGLRRVPPELLQLFGKPQQAMVLLLTLEKKLAHADVHKVAQGLEEQGFYLQLPPRGDRDPDAERIRALNSKLSGH